MPPRLVTRATPNAFVPAPASPPRPTTAALVAAVSARIGAGRFRLWFEGHAQFAHHGTTVVVTARNRHTQEWLQHTFGAAIKEAVAEIYGDNTTVHWTISAAEDGRTAGGNTLNTDHESPNKTKKTKPSSRLSRVVRRQQLSESTIHHRPSSIQRNLFGEPVVTAKPKTNRPNRDEQPQDAEALAQLLAPPRPGRRWKSLADFVTGPCNRVAHASALAVIEEPGQCANPLVIHGPVGTGKTHLLEGIYAGLKRQSEQCPVYVTAEEFTTRFVQASRLGKMSTFRRQFRECSALILDDLHFLATKRATQEEFLHTFDALLSDGRQVVVSTDCHPRLADELMPELIDRLLGGAVWGLLPPDPETRLAILRQKAGGGCPVIPDNVLKTLASSLRGNVRELEGAVNSIRHYAKVIGRPADLQTAREALGDLLRHAVRVVTLTDVDAAVCTVLRLANGTLQSKSRAWTVTHPRMVAIFLCRKHTAATYGEISKYFGAKTHSTAVAAEKKVRTWIEKEASIAIGDRDWPVKELLDRVERQLQR